MTVTLIALGSNDVLANDNATAIIRNALLKVVELGVKQPIQSRLYSTPAFPEGSGPDFVNAAIRLETDLTPEDMLAALHQIEAEAGRERTVRWGQRTLDLDLIAMGDAVLPDLGAHRHWRDLSLEDQVKYAPEQLILPHPRLQDRSFVLVPLADVAPEWVHPILGRSVLEMRDARPAAELASVIPI